MVFATNVAEKLSLPPVRRHGPAEFHGLEIRLHWWPTLRDGRACEAPRRNEIYALARRGSRH